MSLSHTRSMLRWAPTHSDYVVFLEAIEQMTEDDLADALAQCPEMVRAKLAEGPVRGRWDCGVCDAFGKSFYMGQPDVDSPLWRAWAYHEIPKLDMQSSRDMHFGPLANQCYERALMTYRAAGWIGDAAAANA